MPSDPPLDAKNFASAFQGFMEQMAEQAPETKPPIRERLEAHFGCDAATLPTVTERFPMHEHPSMQLAMDRFFEPSDLEVDAFGVVSAYEHTPTRLAQLATETTKTGMTTSVGPIEYVNVALADGELLACVRSGLFLVSRGEERLALRVIRADTFRESLDLEVMGASRELAETTLATLRRSMREHSVYRGKVISLEQQRGQQLTVKFHRLPGIATEDIVLPVGLLTRIERQAIRFAELVPQLQEMGRHLKRGMLLHGPPGTGKTLTAMYLAGQMNDRTVILITGRSMGLIEASCEMARMLAPATIILEDVDLIAKERGTQSGGANTILFELLNQMDGLGDDADILFILTTNRADILEPALAARPGRIDLALEVPLPDEDCRSRLIDLYGEGLGLALDDRGDLIRRTKGASAAFLRELLRKSALIGADEGAATVTQDHVRQALDELLADQTALTQRLLGAASIGG